MTHGALHRVLTHEPIGFRTYYALNVVGQKIFEIHTKHRFYSLPAAFSYLLLAACQHHEKYFLCLTHRYNFHPSQNLRQLDTPAIDSRLHRSLRNLQEVDDLLVTQLFNVSKYHARSQIG